MKFLYDIFIKLHQKIDQKHFKNSISQSNIQPPLQSPADCVDVSLHVRLEILLSSSTTSEQPAVSLLRQTGELPLHLPLVHVLPGQPETLGDFLTSEFHWQGRLLLRSKATPGN